MDKVKCLQKMRRKINKYSMINLKFTTTVFVQKFLLLIFIILFFPIQYGFSQQVWFKSTAFHDGEYLKFKVKWGFIHLGTIEIFQQKINDTLPLYQIEMRARSKNLPFIKVFFINKGILNSYNPTIRNFQLQTGKENPNITTYIFNASEKNIYLKTVEKNEVIRKDTLRCNDSIYDALGIFMMIRCLSASGFQVNLKNIVDFNIHSTGLKFTSDIEQIKTDAFDTPLQAVRFEGQANFVGKAWAGVSGPFSGWVSYDQIAVPLKVKIKIFLGSISLELEEFVRNGEDTTNVINAMIPFQQKAGDKL
jgi:hypothetical protein